MTNSTTYYYVVSAANEGGEGPDSGQVPATPQAPAVPAAPTGLVATAGKRISVVAFNVASATFTNTGLASRVTYYHVGSAIHAAGHGANSVQVSVTAR